MNEKFAHTPGRLVFSEDGLAELKNQSQILQTESGDLVLYFKFHNPEDARRLAACWNACEGVPIDVLDSSMAGGMPWSVPDQIEKMVERDELLVALSLLLHEVDQSAIAGAKDYGWPVAVQKSRAAIALATGKTSEAA